MKNEDIKKAFESLTPNDDAKERMLKAIIAKSAAAPLEVPKENDTPWYVRFKAPIGVCTAAMACAAAFAITILNPGFLDSGKTDNFVETKPVLTTAQTPAYTEDNHSLTAVNAGVKSLSTETNTYKNKTTQSIEETSHGDKFAEAETSLSHTTQTRKTPKPTTATTVVTKDFSEITEQTTYSSAAFSTPEITETAAVTSSSNYSLYGNHFDFKCMSWAGKNYATDYVEVPYDEIEGFLGSGVTVNTETGAVYTVLLYEINGIPIENGFAVQYIGTSNYYRFYNSD